MSTWTMDQVRQVRGLCAEAEVSSEALHQSRHPDTVTEFVTQKVARQLIDAAHAFAVEVHQADLQATWIDRPMARKVEMRWSPTTSEVELRGGIADGQRIAVQRVGEPIRIPVGPAIDWIAPSRAPITPDPVTYELVGWREDERIWVYAAR